MIIYSLTYRVVCCWDVHLALSSKVVGSKVGRNVGLGFGRDVTENGIGASRLMEPDLLSATKHSSVLTA